MPGFSLWKKPLLVLGALFWMVGSATADDNLSPSTGVGLKFEEVRPGQKQQCDGGGILGALDCVTIMIEGAGEDGNVRSLANLGITLTPILRAEGNSRDVKVYVKADIGAPSISDTFENQAQVEADVNADTKTLEERLKRWNTYLRPSHLDDLKTKGETQIEISRPFAGLKRLALETAPVILTIRMPPYKMDMQFLVKTANGYTPATSVKYGDTFVVEVTFTQPQSDPTYFVDLNWDGASMPYEARLERADNTGKLYRSADLRARYLYGPGVELAVDPGGQ